MGTSGGHFRGWMQCNFFLALVEGLVMFRTSIGLLQRRKAAGSRDVSEYPLVFLDFSV